MWDFSNIPGIQEVSDVWILWYPSNWVYDILILYDILQSGCLFQINSRRISDEWRFIPNQLLVWYFAIRKFLSDEWGVISELVRCTRGRGISRSLSNIFNKEFATGFFWISTNIFNKEFSFWISTKIYHWTFKQRVYFIIFWIPTKIFCWIFSTKNLLHDFWLLTKIYCYYCQQRFSFVILEYQKNIVELCQKEFTSWLLFSNT